MRTAQYVTCSCTALHARPAGDAFYLITRGEVKIYVRRQGDSSALGDCQVTMGKGDCFGERALVTLEPRNATVVAATPVVDCLMLHRTAFSMLLSGEKRARIVLGVDWAIDRPHTVSLGVLSPRRAAW